jgi:pimeloyl-ACP methyl ester carboxylesterase
MLAAVIKKSLWLVLIVVLLELGIVMPAQAQSENTVRVKELNFVFLHGAGGNACSMQLLSDTILEQIEPYILDYEAAHPDIDIQVHSMNRCYPNDVDMPTWANNIADSVGRYLEGGRNVILVGHSAGGKAALYGVANDVGSLSFRTAMVVTINAPIKPLANYYVTGGASVTSYCQARWLGADQGICRSLANYDSTADGSWVAENRHWLAFISAESAPSSAQFDYSGVDAWPRNMDDGLVPISAQYSDAADVVYYGEHGHGDFEESEAVAGAIAEQILQYIFGGTIECSVFVRSDTFEHKANWLPGTDYWDDILGGILVDSGRLEHFNDSYFWWQDWQDVAGESPEDVLRSTYEAKAVDSFLFFNSLLSASWLNPDDTGDCRLYLRTRAAPRNWVKVDWVIYRQGLLPEGGERDHYEVEIFTGTPLTGIKYAMWLNEDPRDLRAHIYSQAESPFRWFKAQYRVYAKEPRYRQIIDEFEINPVY